MCVCHVMYMSVYVCQVICMSVYVCPVTYISVYAGRVYACHVIYMPVYVFHVIYFSIYVYQYHIIVSVTQSTWLKYSAFFYCNQLNLIDSKHALFSDLHNFGFRSVCPPTSLQSISHFLNVQ